MATCEDLEAAVSAGILTEQAAADLAGFLGEKLPTTSKTEGQSTLSGPQLGGEEPLRFIRNFHDVFLAMGLQILFAGVFVFAGITAASRAQSLFADVELDNPLALFAVLANNAQAALWASFAGTALIAGFIWLLAEYFAGRKRLFFPAIIICLNFALTVCVAAFIFYAAVFLRDAGLVAHGAMSGDPVLKIRLIPVYMVASALAPIIGYYIRFKLPFAMGLIGIFIVALAVTTVGVFNWGLVYNNLPIIILASGIVLFIFGMVFDVRDPQRVSRFSDNGFWLHLAAAQFILNGTAELVIGDANQTSEMAAAAPAYLGTIFVFAIISLLINRRALVVSGMLTAGIVLGFAVWETDIGAAGAVGATLLTLGVVMVLLGAGWHWLRRMLIAPLPKTGIIARIFPPEIGADG